MKHWQKWLMAALVGVAVTTALALIASGGQDSLAAEGTIYVDADAGGANNGTSWEDAFTTLQPALDEAVVGAQIWVAEGIYTPTHEFSPGDPRSATFQLKNGVALYGGFDPSMGDVGWEVRDWVNNVTILTGELGDPGNADNSYHVFYHPPELALDRSAVLDGFTVTGGNADSSPDHAGGGGVFNFGSSPTLARCTFSDNSASRGGGMYNLGSSSPAVYNCTFSRNSADHFGGGMANSSSSSPAVTNCTFSGNSASSGGGMYSHNYSSPAMTNCTFSGNSAGSTGGGMYNFYHGSPAVTNCILWGDSPNEISNYESQPTVTYSDVQGGYGGTGNIDAEPLFVDPGSDDYHLGPGSPCIDAGTNDVPNLPDYDFEGDPRVMDGDEDEESVVDMGVDEAWGILIYVDQDATGDNNGTTWEDAYTTLQPALEEVADGHDIWVAEGTYAPTQESSPGDPRSVTFQLKNGVALYGGFDPSMGDVGWANRDWVNNITVLSGDIGAQGDPADNSYHVFYHPPELALDGSAALDGFTVTGGNANDDDWPNGAGGGMYNHVSSPSVTNCTFSDNSAFHEGGGMYNLDSSSPLVSNCTFSGNSAGYAGGGMYCLFSSSPSVTNCTFSGNSATYGGGMWISESSPSVTNCTFSGNSADGGGGMYNHGNSLPSVTNCTFSGNSASWVGGGMSNSGSSPVVTNCILWGDSPDEIYNEMGEPAVTYSDIQGGHDGTGNIDEDPLFVDPGSGDYHLDPGSPCIDAGTNDAPDLPTHDFEGDPRVMDANGDGAAVVDMGIDEVLGLPQYVIYYVDQDAAGVSDGTTWEDAHTTIQPALDEAADGDEIWVAAGTYYPSVEHGGRGDRYKSFQLKNGVALYGGFDPSVGDIGWGDRDWVNNVTILSGDIGIAGNASDNSYHVFYHPLELALDGSAVLDGFTVAGGKANGDSYVDKHGGGMYNDLSSPSVTNCTFSDNWASSEGGGMYNHSSSPSVTNCTFSDNSAGEGGGMFGYVASPVVTNCTFSGNSAGLGGGMFNGLYSWPEVTNCTFSRNSAGGYGGGMYNYHSSSAVTNCAFSGNSAGSDGGGMYNYYHGSPTVTNCILWGDSPDEISNDTSQPAVTYSDIQGGYDGIGNIDADPRFVNPGNGDYHLGPASPCIDAGTNDASNLPSYDFEGDPRIRDGNGDGTAVVDMGVDEAFWYALYLPLVLRGY